ncbi:FixH family protein [Paenibacillus sp. 481]|uniref:FixH family protein n=1 Tax=Paenibacillus sp. 481 TaxID=2835869 RepID=UPI001E56C221|nr:FixH family protein [Paenibacillus sp. 481]UHA73088.1 FixH family protein [Paenibacillus sp. 481]
MWKRAAVAVSLILAITTGCGGDHAGHGGHEGHGKEQTTGELIKVELTVPQTAKVNASVVMTANVTLSEKAVENAEKVEFEIVDESGKSEKISVKHKEAGNYELAKAFDKAGKYKVISHVSANGMHSMPNKTIEVK